MDMNRLSLVTAKRLRAMRLKKGLSHVALSQELKEKYDINISRNSLMNYEVADSHHSKAFTNGGMKVEYLRILADYYNVSTDWLLGLSNVKTSKGKARQACNYTGLSSKNIEYFHRWTEKTSTKGSAFLLFINTLMENLDFQIMIDHIYDWYVAILAENVFQILQKKYAHTDRKAFRIAIDDMMHRPDLSPEFRVKLLECTDHYIDAMDNSNSLQVSELYAYRASQDLTMVFRNLQNRISKQDSD